MSKRKHNQQYKDEYSELWPVIKRSKLSKNYIFCSICNVDINIAHGGKDDCRRHVECNRHLEKAKLMASHQNLRNHFVIPEDFSVIQAESLFTGFLIEHNVPLSAADHAGDLFRKMFPDSKIAAKYGCARTKTSAIIKSFAKSTVNEVAEKLKSSKFTLATDGSNSLGNEKLFPILVTFFDLSLEKNSTMMLSLPSLKIDATGENIFLLIDGEMKRFEVPWNNCLSFGADNAFVMSGKLKGVVKFIQERNEKISFSGCACHLVHLAAQHATKALKFPVEEFLVDIFYYLRKSSKRVENFKLCQSLCDVEIHKILKYGSTRWLSLENVINRTLEQWEPLKMFFCDKESGDSEALLRIQKRFQEDETKLYLLFLQSVLPIFTKTNIFLQSEAPMVHKLRRTLISLYTDCLSRFITPEAVQNSTDIFAINVEDRKFQKSKENLVIGYKTKQYLKNVDTNISNTSEKNFFKSIRSFFEKACTYMSKKFPMQDKLLTNAEVADITIRTKVKFESLAYFFDVFSDILTESELNQAEVEFAQYQQDELTPDIIECSRADTTWSRIKNLLDLNMCSKYKVLPNIMLNILLFPHSNASCERIFSTIRKNQTEFRPNLSTQTLESLIIQKCKFSNNELCCYKQNFTREELSKAKKATYESLK